MFLKKWNTHEDFSIQLDFLINSVLIGCVKISKKSLLYKSYSECVKSFIGKTVNKSIQVAMVLDCACPLTRYITRICFKLQYL